MVYCCSKNVPSLFTHVTLYARGGGGAGVWIISQAVAAGLGGRAVAAVLAALCLNHKHFGGGLPDLLLMRAVRQTVEGADVMTVAKDALVDGVGGSGGTAPLRSRVDGGDPEVSTVRMW